MKRYYRERMNYIKGDARTTVAVLYDKRWLPDEFYVYKTPEGIAWHNAVSKPREGLKLVGKFREYDRYDETVKQVEMA